MTDWSIVIAIVTIGAVIFGAVWILYQDVKKGVHARIGRLENVTDEIVRDCGKKKDEFITVRAFDRFEKNIMDRIDGMTKRFDDFLVYTRNGHKEK